MLSITREQQYYNKWNDDIEFIVYENEVSREYSVVKHVNHSGSKRKLLLSLLEPTSVSDEATFIIENIKDIHKIEILEQSSVMLITTDNSEDIIVKGVSNSFIETIKKL